MLLQNITNINVYSNIIVYYMNFDLGGSKIKILLNITQGNITTKFDCYPFTHSLFILSNIIIMSLNKLLSDSFNAAKSAHDVNTQKYSTNLLQIFYMHLSRRPPEVLFY